MLQRFLTGAILVVLTLLVLFYMPMNVFAIISALLVLWAAWEWARLLKLSRVFSACYMVILLVLMTVVHVLWLHELVVVAGFVAWFWALWAVVAYVRGAKPLGLQVPVLQAVVGLLVLLSAWSSLNMIRAIIGPSGLLFALVIVWAADSGAYFLGKSFGKHHLAPNLSPKKTWEGFFAGMIFALIIAAVVSLYVGWLGGFWSTLLYTAVLVVAALFGDLFESMLKRMAGMKDSGNVLPGHGGILDRLDSMLIALPLFLLFMLIH